MTTAVQEVAQQQEKEKQIKAIYNEKFVGNFTRKELDVLRNTIARGTNEEEFGLFVQTCVNTGLNPFLNHIHCMVFEGRNGRQLSIQISSEGVLYLARRNKGFKGIDAQMVHENDEFVIDLATKKIVKHEIRFPRGRLVGGYCIARHEEFEDKILLMDVAEVEHMKKGRNGHMWMTWFADMFKKHMLKRVAKEQYGIDLTEHEEQPASSIDNLESYPSSEPGVIAINEHEVVREDEKLQELWKEIEMNVPEAIILNSLKKYFKGRADNELTLQEVVALRKYCIFEMNNAEKQKQQEPKQQEPIETEIVEEQEYVQDEFSGFFD